MEPSSLDVQSNVAVRFTCVVGGHPINSVSITGPNSLNLDCLAQTSTNKASCKLLKEKDNRAAYVVEIRNAGSADDGTYNCDVRSRLYRFTQDAEGRKSSFKTVEKDSHGVFKLNYCKSTDRISYGKR